MIAQKIWEVEPKKIFDFRILHPTLNPTILGRMEINFLMMLDFNTFISPSLYTIYYFELMTLSNTRTFAVQKKLCYMKPLRKYEGERVLYSSHGNIPLTKNKSIHQMAEIASAVLQAVKADMDIGSSPHLVFDKRVSLSTDFPQKSSPQKSWSSLRSYVFEKMSKTLEDFIPSMLFRGNGFFLIPSCP